MILPYLLLARAQVGPPGSFGPAQVAGVFFAAAGASIYFWCLWDFAVVGRGTPAPVDPPKRLVVRGPYRYVRNPMYIGVLLVLLGEVLFFEYPGLLAYVAAFLLVVHLFVVFYEEPTLLRKFGEPYDRYRRSVRRWWPGRPYDSPEDERS